MRRITRHIYGILVVAALGLMMSCNEGKSYSDLLRDEEVAVNWYLAQNRVEPRVPEDSVFVTGPEAPFYRMDRDGHVYMRVVNPGDMDNRPKKGETVYFRFMRQNVKYLKEGLTSGVGNSEDMGSSVGSMSLVYGNTTLPSTTQYGEGLQVPLRYLGYNCEVDLMEKSNAGMSADMADCIPYVYKGLKFFKAEY